MTSLGTERFSVVDASLTKQVHSLEDAMKFYDTFLDEILLPDGDGVGRDEALDPQRVSINYLADWISKVTHSSCFSGIGAPETALLALHHAIQKRVSYQDRTSKNGRKGRESLPNYQRPRINVFLIFLTLFQCVMFKQLLVEKESLYFQYAALK